MHFKRTASHHVVDDSLAMAVNIWLTCVHDGTRVPPECTVPPTILTLVKNDTKLATYTLCLALYEISRPWLTPQMLDDLVTDRIFANLPVWSRIQGSFHALRDKDSPWANQLDVLNLLRAFMPVMLDLVDPPTYDIVADETNANSQPPSA